MPGPEEGHELVLKDGDVLSVYVQGLGGVDTDPQRMQVVGDPTESVLAQIGDVELVSVRYRLVEVPSAQESGQSTE